MTNNAAVIVIGFPELAEGLKKAQGLGSVHAVPSITAFRAELAKPKEERSFPTDPQAVTLVVSDNLDDEVGYELVLGKLLPAGVRILMLNVSGNAVDFLARYPSLNVLRGTMSPNRVLGSLKALNHPGDYARIDGGDDDVRQKAPEASSELGEGALDITANPKLARLAEMREQSAAAPAQAPEAPQRSGGWNSLGDGGWQTLDPTGAPASAPTPAPAPTPSPAAPKPAPAPGPKPAPKPVPKPAPKPATAAATKPAPAPAGGPASAAPAPAPAPSPAPAPKPMESGWQSIDVDPPAPAPRKVVMGEVIDPAAGGPKLHSPDRCKVISIVSPKGGAGKSTLSLNVAAFLGIHTNRQVAIVDLNIQQADIAKYLYATRERTVVDVVKNLATITPSNIDDYMPYSQAGNLYALLGPYLPRQADPQILRPEVYQQILAVLRQRFDYIVLDTPVAEYYHPLISDFALPNSDHVAAIVTPNWATVANAYNYLKAIVEEETGPRVPIEKIGWVLNQAQEGIDCSLEDVQQNLGRYRYLGQIPYSEVWLKAANNFQMAVTYGNAEIDAAFGQWIGTMVGVDFSSSVNMVDQSTRGGFLKKLLGRR